MPVLNAKLFVFLLFWQDYIIREFSNFFRDRLRILEYDRMPMVDVDECSSKLYYLENVLEQCWFLFWADRNSTGPNLTLSLTGRIALRGNRHGKWTIASIKSYMFVWLRIINGTAKEHQVGIVDRHQQPSRPFVSCDRLIPTRENQLHLRKSSKPKDSRQRLQSLSRFLFSGAYWFMHINGDLNVAY